MKQLVDARGLPCPQPVIKTSNAMENSNEITVIVDNDIAVENVTRLARSKGFSVQVRTEKDGIYIDLTKEAETGSISKGIKEEVGENAGRRFRQVLLISSNKFGEGSDELGERLLSAFLHVLTEGSSKKPQTIVFVNSGVKLVVENSSSLDDLKLLSQAGIEILACGTCLNYYNLTEKIKVGRISNMYEILEKIMEADKVIKL